jgi:hypothetical protein
MRSITRRVTRRRQQRLAGGDHMHRRDQLLWSGALEQETRGAGPEGTEDIVVLLEGRQDQDSRCGGRPRQLAGGADPVQVGHAHVHQHDIRRELARLLDGLPSRRCLADDLDLGVDGEQLDEPGAHQVVVVGDQHPHQPR